MRFAIVVWLAACALMLATEWPGPLASVLVLPYVLAVWPFRSLPDVDCEQANRGWRRFLAINYVVGFAVTLLLIGYVTLG